MSFVIRGQQHEPPEPSIEISTDEGSSLLSSLMMVNFAATFYLLDLFTRAYWRMKDTIG